MKLLQVISKKYSDEKLASYVDNVKEFNYLEMDASAVASVIMPIFMSEDIALGKYCTDIKYTSVDAVSKLELDGKSYTIFELSFLLTVLGNKERTSILICPFGCLRVDATKSGEIQSYTDALERKITVALIEFMSSKYGISKDYVQKCKKFVNDRKKSLINVEQNKISSLERSLNYHKKNIEEINKIYDEKNLGLN